MPRPIFTSLRKVPGLVLLALLVAAPASALTSELRILMNVDVNPTTGCDVTTVDGVFPGVEQILVTTVETQGLTGEVTLVERRECVDEATDTFGPAIPVSAGGWPVGVGLGVDGSEVVETFVSVSDIGGDNPPPVIRLGVVGDNGVEEDALLVVRPVGNQPILLNLVSVLAIPTLSEWGLILLALLLATLALGRMRRMQRRHAVTLLVLICLGISVVAWASVRDGLIDDWLGVSPLAEDAQGDAPLGADLRALFAKALAGEICFRLDVFLEFNQPPDAVDDDFIVTEDTTDNSLDVLANDTDPENDPLTITDVGTPDQGGTATTDGSTITYTPAPDFKGTETFTYTIEDDAGGTDTATVTVTVENVNDDPDAVDDDFTVDEDSTDNPLDVLANDTDAPDMGETLTVTAVGMPDQGGSVSITGGGTGVSYTPAMDFAGVETFTYTIEDGNGGMDTATVTVTVTNANDPPDAVDDNFMVEEDSTDNSLDVLANDTSAPDVGETLTITAVGATDQGGTATTDGSTITYTPAANFVGVETFTYTIGDGNGGGDMATVTVTVADANMDPPVCGADSAMTDEDNSTLVDVLANDTDPDPGQTVTLTVLSVDTTGTTGMVTNNGTDVTYDPNGGFDSLDDGEMDTDTFTYTAVDDDGLTCMATVTVTLTGVNDAPMVVGETFDVAAGNFDPAIGNTTLQFANTDTVTHPHVFIGGSVLDNDLDPDDALTISAVDGDGGAVGSPKVLASGAVVTLEADGEFIYSPPLGFEGMDSFTYTVFDGTASVMATVTIEIAEMVWYLDNLTDGTGDDGRSGSPFDSIEQFDAQNGGGNADDPEAGDIIFIHEGSGVYDAGAAGAAGIDLLDQQKLWGEGIGLTVLGHNLVAAGNRPQVDNTNGGGLGVRVAATVADRTGIEIRGLAISGDQNAIFVGSSGTFATEVTISDNLIDDAGGAGIDLNPGSSGDFTVTVSNNDWSTTSPAGNGLDLTTVAGNSADVFLALDNNSDITGGGAGVNVDGTAGTGTVYVTSLSGNTVNGATAADGMRFDTVVFDADPSDANFTGDTVAAGATVIGTTVDRVSGSGLVLDTVTGDLSFTDLDIANDGGTGLRVVSAATFNPVGTGFRLTTGAGSTVNTTNGPAVDIDPATLAASFSSIFNTNSTTVGVSLTDAEGSFSAAGGSITTAGMASGPTFQVSGGSVTASFAGLVSSAVGNSVQVQNMTGGTVMVTGIVDDDGAGISITANDNATSVTFAGGLDLDTTTNTAFTATGDGSVTVAASANNNNVDTTTGTALLVNGVDLTSAFDSVSVANGGGVGISLQSSAGTKGLGLVSITNSGGAGLFASNAGTVNVTNAASSIATTGQPAVDADNTTFGATFASLTSDDSASTGLDLASIGGSFTATTVAIDDTTGAGVQLTGNTATVTLAGGTIGETTNSATTTGGNAVDVDGGTGDVTIAAEITNTAARAVEVTGRATAGSTVNLLGNVTHTANVIGIDVTGNSDGATVFGGPGKVIDSSTANAVNLVNNTGHTIAFIAGGLDIDTTTGNGFHATGGGTVEVDGPLNTVNTTTGIGVNIVNTTIGAANVTFESVSVNGAANGILLNSTGTDGGLIVTGDGSTAGSGGTIQNTTSDGVRLITSNDASLQFMNVTGSGANGIFGTNVDGFGLVGVALTNNGNAVDEGGIRFADTDPVNPTQNGLVGTASFDGVTLDYPAAGSFGEHHVEILNISGSLDLTITDSVFQNTNNSTVIGADGFLMETRSTASATLAVTGSTFDNNFTDSIQLLAIDSSSIQAQIGEVGMGNANTFTDSERAVSLSNATNGDLFFEVVNNDMTGHNGHSLLVVSTTTTTASAELKGSIDGNRIGTGGVANSGSASGHGIQLDLRGNVDSHISVDGNTIRETNLRGINYDARLGAGDLEAEIINNMIDDVFDGVEMRTRDGHNLCTIISDNTVTNVNGNDAYHIRESDPTHNVETAEANATAQVTNNNTGTPVTVEATVGTVAVGTCDLSGTDLP